MPRNQTKVPGIQHGPNTGPLYICKSRVWRWSGHSYTCGDHVTLVQRFGFFLSLCFLASFHVGTCTIWWEQATLNTSLKWFLFYIWLFIFHSLGGHNIGNTSVHSISIWCRAKVNMIMCGRGKAMMNGCLIVTLDCTWWSGQWAHNICYCIKYIII